MGNTLSCCLCPNASRKRVRSLGSAKLDYESEVYEVAPRDALATAPSPAALEPAQVHFKAGEGNHVQQHISNPEMPEDSALESNPPDHPRASPVFLSKSQTDVQENEKINHVWPTQIKKYNSCSTIFLDDSTVIQPNLRTIINGATLAIYNYIMYRDGNRSLNIFDERKHPLTQEKVPGDYFKHEPKLKFVSRFLHALFSDTGLRVQCIIISVDGVGKTFWKLLQFHSNVSASVYTTYYFHLRSLAYDSDVISMFTAFSKQRAQKLEAISGLFEDNDYKDLCRAAMTRSLSTDNVIVFERSNAILP